jgi:Stress responsive A/B Barrel Domain
MVTSTYQGSGLPGAPILQETANYKIGESERRIFWRMSRDHLLDSPHVIGSKGDVTVVDHLVFFEVRQVASPEEVEDLLSSIRALKDQVSSTVDLSVGEDFSGRSGGYTHALFARFEDAEGLREYMEHPAHLAVVEKLEATTTGRIVADYEF